MSRGFRLGLAFGALGFAVSAGVSGRAAGANAFVSRWPADVERVWVGPAYWANRLQDWRIARGRLECVVGGPDRNVHLLTHQLGKQAGDLRMSVRLGQLFGGAKVGEGWVGFRIAAHGQFDDYRDSVIRGRGIDAGITMGGRLFISEPGGPRQEAPGPLSLREIELRLRAEPNGDKYKLTLTALNPADPAESGSVTARVPAAGLWGNLALVCHSARRDGRQRGNVRFRFSDWSVSGGKIDASADRAFGPILFAQYTLSKNVLKMTAQMPPIGERDTQTVRLQIHEGGDTWKTVSEAPIDGMSRTATFRVENWDASRDTPYRLAYALIGPDGKPEDRYWTGTVRREPIDKESIVVAGFTGNNDEGFPNNDVVKHVKAHDPDVLVFTGDQIYERVAGYGCQTRPVDMATLDYVLSDFLQGSCTILGETGDSERLDGALATMDHRGLVCDLTLAAE